MQETLSFVAFKLMKLKNYYCREKMAFLANLKSSVPIVNEEDVVDTDDEVELASLNQVTLT